MKITVGVVVGFAVGVEVGFAVGVDVGFACKEMKPEPKMTKLNREKRKISRKKKVI